MTLFDILLTKPKFVGSGDDKYRQHMTREDEIMNSMREQREDAYKEGREEGKEQAKKEDALKLKQLGVSVDVISQATGLPIDIINNL